MIKELITKLATEKEHIFIQTHNFPDPDAVASAYGLQQLLELKTIKSLIIYDGVIQRTALNKMILDFKIEICPSHEVRMTSADKIIIVDGCKRNKNVTDLIGEEIAVIDHHRGKEPDDVEFVEIRPEVGACSSMISGYYSELNLEIPEDAATVLMTGLFRDTDCMTRGVHQTDVNAYNLLFQKADNLKVNSIILNNITLQDLTYYSTVITNLKTKGDIAYCFIEKECNQNLLGILGDFLLSLEEIKFTALFAKNKHVLNISFRNEKKEINAAAVMKEVVAGIGSGGGHREMAGGVINEKARFDPENIFEKIITIINR